MRPPVQKFGVLASGAVFLAGCSSVSTASEAAEVYDASAIHQVSVEVDEDAFEAMLVTYQDTEEKEWITATVTLDGETFDQVGLRLKGNSSLRQVDDEAAPSDLPWLIRLDANVEGQSLDGYSEFVIRSSSSETSLNEAVALDLLAEAGLATEHAVATAFSVNGEEARLRLMVQHLDETWEAENFTTSGQLYKAESSGDYSYRGTDSEAYDDVFDQETGEEDLTPLIEFLDFVNNSTDAEFAEQLGDHLEVDAFATYLALEDLLGNFDDIDGPGNNSYLRYDSDADKFTVVAWDHNMTFGLSPGGGGRGGPDGMEPPAGRERGSGPGGAPAGQANPLVTRFLANTDFKAAYDDATTRLTATLIDNGTAVALLSKWAEVLTSQGDDLVAAEVVAAEAEQIEEFLAEKKSG